mgnify:CR=1 FL=1
MLRHSSIFALVSLLSLTACNGDEGGGTDSGATETDSGGTDTDGTGPLGAYGASKLAGPTQTQTSLPGSPLRISWPVSNMAISSLWITVCTERMSVNGGWTLTSTCS